jgi:hypothetical protein
VLYVSLVAFKKNRIHLLTENKINELYNIPNFTDQEMEIFFSLSNTYGKQPGALISNDKFYFIFTT